MPSTYIQLGVGENGTLTSVRVLKRKKGYNEVFKTGGTSPSDTRVPKEKFYVHAKPYYNFYMNISNQNYQ